VSAAARSIAIDRYHDEAWRLLIDAYERDGDLAAARRARARYAQVLTDLGLDPAAGSPIIDPHRPLPARRRPGS
jgi:DNA-binding SARP family transcriptional activator